jgi:hypothetical protein
MIHSVTNGQTVLHLNSTPTATQPSQSTEYDSALNSKRPDGELVKETSPPSKFLGLCTTIQSHDLFTSPINKTVGAPSFFTKPLAFKSLPTQGCFSNHQRGPKNQWRLAATGAAPPMRRKEAAPAHVGGSDRHLLL